MAPTKHKRKTSDPALVAIKIPADELAAIEQRFDDLDGNKSELLDSGSLVLQRQSFRDLGQDVSRPSGSSPMRKYLEIDSKDWIRVEADWICNVSLESILITESTTTGSATFFSIPSATNIPWFGEAYIKCNRTHARAKVYLYRDGE
jgi:hypothetical protein